MGAYIECVKTSTLTYEQKSSKFYRVVVLKAKNSAAADALDVNTVIAPTAQPIASPVAFGAPYLIPMKPFTFSGGLPTNTGSGVTPNGTNGTNGTNGFSFSGGSGGGFGFTTGPNNNSNGSSTDPEDCETAEDGTNNGASNPTNGSTSNTTSNPTTNDTSDSTPNTTAPSDPTTGTNTNDGESSAGMSTNLAQNDDSIVELTEESREEEVAELEQKTVNPKKEDEIVVENESTAEEQQKDSVVENETVVEERQEVVVEDSQEEDKESVGGASTNCTQYFLSTTPEDYSKVFS